jgi:hypothetical protein
MLSSNMYIIRSSNMVALESEEVLLYRVFWNRMIIAPDPIYRVPNTSSFSYSSPFMYNPKSPSIEVNKNI